MDEVRAFFNNPHPTSSQRIKLRGPLTGGHSISKHDTLDDFDRHKDHRHTMFNGGTDYVEEAKLKEMKLFSKNEEFDSRPDGLNALDQMSSLGSLLQSSLNLNDEVMTHVYNKYTFKRKEDTKNLVINDYQEEIVRKLNAYPVIIIEGPTGCGKTTQVPQWILDDCYNNRRPCKIIVTQPRKIAAISISKRVAQERGWNVGGVVGYQIALENKTSSDTLIHYVTTGVLLQKLVNAKTMNEYTHVIIDEVHERGQEMDFLLIVVKRLLNTVSPKIKVVLMSATFNTGSFFDYFVPNVQPCVVNIRKERLRYSVKTFYLNNLSKFFGVGPETTKFGSDPELSTDMHHLVVKLVNAFEYIDKTEEFEKDDISEEDLPSVLIFLPGINEIEDLYSCLTDVALRRKLVDADCAKLNWWVLPLHSTITADEQVRVFQRAPPGHRKIILSTNIAESSITVPDIKYVIDYCLMKVLEADPSTNFTALKLRWATKTNCEQRAGRAGRVRDGRVYRLIEEKHYVQLPEDCQPEIQRCPLERLVLLAKTLDMGPPSDILALAMDPPDLSNIHRTVLVLKEVGALKKLENDVADGELTNLGRIMATLPLDVRVAKLIMLGHIFGCLDECVIMAAAMSVKNVFSSPFRERLNAYNSKLTWADGSTSDCIAFLNVYKVWNHLRQGQYFSQAGNNEAQWARRFYVQLRALRELEDMLRELRIRLSREGIEATNRKSPWSKQELPIVLKVLIAGAFYPQYFVQVGGEEDRERDAVRTLGGLDPRTSVYLRGWPDHQPAEVYASTIKNIVAKQIGDEPRVTFDTNSKKIYLTFDNNMGVQRNKDKSGDPTIPGQVVLPIYKAIKARQLKMDIRIPLLPLEKANVLLAAMKSHKRHSNIDKLVPRLPDIDETHFPLKISQLINVGRFWVQYDDASTAADIRQIQSALNRKPLQPVSTAVTVDALVAAPYADDSGTQLYRAKVTKTHPRDMYEVFYIDYGSVGRVSGSSLRLLPEGCGSSPPLAMQCVLAELSPAPLLHPHGHWSSPALKMFTDLVQRGRLIGKVYSVTHGVVAVELMAEGGRISVNCELIAKGYAVRSEESYDSKMNHDLRETALEFNVAQRRAYNKEQTELAYSQICEVEAPSYKDCTSDALLKGPTSPLETTLHSIMYAGREKQVNVEWNSVNSVLLDTEPQQMYERLLVAAEVGHSELSGKLTLRHTTMMPNIPGLPAILSLLFCPFAELRRSSSGSRYVSVLCGLGSAGGGRPRFPEHDLLVNIDADLSVDEIGLINHIRYLMDYTMSCTMGASDTTDNVDFTPNIPKLIRDDLMKLLLRRRKHRAPEWLQSAWEWESVPADELLEISVPAMLERADVFPLHAPPHLAPVCAERLLQLKRATDELKGLVGRSSVVGTSTQVTCKLCGTVAMPPHVMRIHLYSNAHREKEEDLKSIAAN
ncbi:probable ATP-dependent RNA helicase spindle-E [Leptidea sinapis]|uniref:probable ATP-dependent RNA helicase spindle-E n=1 Tax=Leptidea sinapis TaxID=189913 RepID=UPI0021C305AB|nr:probable ATP-dependent RNA helicase spindle-E [Leptidea sinapis]XP_050675303.1 probable ATP-dependent RNA helicase spindle-E [Leptidea sinapis]XP_050675304.1 probable ATP-dependent RNA helicase spindle-E [Leptidea sinapis]